MIRAVHYEQKNRELSEEILSFAPERVKDVQEFHRSFPGYRETPLVSLRCLAEQIGAESIYVKDESYRFGLNAFKVLGGSYCIGRYIADKLGREIRELPFDVMTGQEVRDRLGEQTFITATDGNHGRGIAWTAKQLGQKSVVYMPRGTKEERLLNIRALGAEASVLDMNYDDTVRRACRDAQEHGWILTQDTSWEGYEKIPEWIMKGYTTMAAEAVSQLAGVRPTHVFLQAGVGSMAGAAAAYLSACFGADRPVITIVEPDKADCIFRTAEAADGKLHTVTGDLDTVMAGLACGEPCPLAWEILKDCAGHFISMPDYVAEKGMRILGRPCGNDRTVISGESGAAALGFAVEVMTDPRLADLKEKIGLDRGSRILCFSTEGATDRENYSRILRGV